MSLKNPVTTPGIDPGAGRLVAQRLNHYTTPSSVSEIIPFDNPRENQVAICFPRPTEPDFPSIFFKINSGLTTLPALELQT